MSTGHRTLLRQALAVFATFTVIGLAFGMSNYANDAIKGHVEQFPSPFLECMLSMYSFALLTPGIAWAINRSPIRQMTLDTSWRYALIVLAAVGARLLIFLPALHALHPEIQLTSPNFYIAFVATDICIIGGMVAAILALKYYQDSNEHRLNNAQLESSLAEAQLHTLRDQLQPHFLFNTLNAMVALIRVNPSRAEDMSILLSDLLRAGLERSENNEVKLADEIALLEKYIEIMKIRLGERLKVSLNVSSSVLPTSVPNFLLQPLVENAIKYGEDPLTGNCIIDISASSADGGLRLIVRDHGPGFASLGSPKDTPGLGIQNLRERLRRLYGAEATLLTRDVENAGGAQVIITLPRAPTAAAASSAEPQSARRAIRSAFYEGHARPLR